MYEVAPLPDSVTEVPAQTIWSRPAFTAGKEFTVTKTASVLVQPFPSVPVTV